MQRESMRSTSAARLALCAKVAGVRPVQWLDITTMADSRRRYARVAPSRVQVDMLADGRVLLSANRTGGSLDARYAPMAVDVALSRALPEILGELSSAISPGWSQ